MKVELEYELNRKWLFHDGEDEPYGEVNFVISANCLAQLYQAYFARQWHSLNIFLEGYEPETEGELLYQSAKTMGEVREELTTIYN